MFLWAPLPAAHAASGSLQFAAELLERAGVAVAPGVGFGPGGDGYVRFSLIESDDRVRQACAQVGKFLKAQ
jgi:alanine-synthesizing transaminase